MNKSIIRLLKIFDWVPVGKSRSNYKKIYQTEVGEKEANIKISNNKVLFLFYYSEGRNILENVYFKNSFIDYLEEIDNVINNSYK